MLQHILHNHLPFFIAKHGNPSIWNTQGLEKSHYMAHNAYFRHTQHGGTHKKANSLKELFQWFYRRILQRLHQKKVLEESKTAQILRVIQRNKRATTFRESKAIEGQKRWRENMLYENHRWTKRE